MVDNTGAKIDLTIIDIEIVFNDTLALKESNIGGQVFNLLVQLVVLVGRKILLGVTMMP